MKKLISSFLVAAAAIMPFSAKADNLNVEQAKSAAAYYLMQNSHVGKINANELTLVRQIDNPDLGVASVYYFNAPKGGWLIMAATTVIDPIIGFSSTGTLDVENLPDNMTWWVESYARQVSEIQVLDSEEDLPDSPEWQSIANGKLPEAKGAVVLMEEYWDQGRPTRPTYNLYCPKVDGRTSVVGCVATALSQLCHYYRYPVQPKGRRVYQVLGTTIRINYDTVSYNYDLMPNSLNGASTAQIEEVAKLCYTMGVAVKMDYHPNGSGSNNSNAMAAMKNIFKYNEGQYIHRATYGDQAFVDAIRAELLKKNPVYMTGASSIDDGSGDAAGHAWLCAGYRTEEPKQYYMNWGWGGTSHGDGFFNLADNDMYSSRHGYNFNVNQGAIIGFTPPDDSNRHFVGIVEAENTTLAPAYPNPATMSVTLPYSLESDADLRIYGMDGRLVETRRLQAGNGHAVVRVDNLPAGIYIYRLNGAAGKFIVK